MVTAPRSRPATRRDLEALPENVVGEILAGELVVSPRPAAPHALASSRLGARIGARFDGPRRDDGGGGWWILDEPELELGDDVLVPDIAGWRRERMPQLPDVAAFTLPPDCVCEVLSPSTARTDRLMKLPIYLRAKVGHVWLVDPATQTIEVLRRTEAGWLVATSVVGDIKSPIEPFETAELDLVQLWDRGADAK